MGRLCVLDKCSTNSCLIKPRDVQLHRFPSDPSTKAKWEEWVRKVEGPNLKDFVATKSTHTVCSRHFRPSDYMRKRLCYQAVPSVPPEPSVEVSSKSSLQTLNKPSHEAPMGIISNIQSLAAPRSQRSSRLKAASSNIVLRRSLPTRSQTQTLVRPVAGIALAKRSLSPPRLRSRAGQTSKHTGKSSPAYNLSVVRAETNTGSEVGSAGTAVKYSFSPSKLLRDTSKQMAAPEGTLKSSSTPLRSSKNVCTQSVNDRTPEPQAKRKCYVGDISRADFECPVKAQISLNVATSEVTKTKRKLQVMQLKYVRAMKKIKTLEHMITLFKEQKDPMHEELLIKVCSTCRKVNVCP